MVSFEATNAFNICRRSRMFQCLPAKDPTLARFINAIYWKIAPPLFVPASTRTFLHSEEGTQQGDPAGMLLFSLAIQPLIPEIEAGCNLDLNRWNADDGILMRSKSSETSGPISASHSTDGTAQRAGHSSTHLPSRASARPST